MDSKTLQPWQAKAICKALYPGANYLIHLRRRMEERGFPPVDNLYKLVCAAYEAVNHLANTTHHMSCGGTEAPRSFGK
jgi:hypothetical protein